MKKLLTVFVAIIAICTISITSFASATNGSYYSSHREHCVCNISSRGDVISGTMGAETCKGNQSIASNVKTINQTVDRSCEVTQYNLTATYGFHVINVTTGFNGSCATYGYDY